MAPLTPGCPSGRYGEKCHGKCTHRHCYGSQRCEPTTGECVDGCIAGWQGVSCTEGIGILNYNCNIVYTILYVSIHIYTNNKKKGTLLVLLLLLLLSLLLLLLLFVLIIIIVIIIFKFS